MAVTRRSPTSPGRRLALPLAVTLVSAGGLAACSREPGPDAALSAFAAAWQGGTVDRLSFLSATGAPMSGSQVATELKTIAGDLTAAPKVTPVGKAKAGKNDAVGTLTVAWPVTAGATWTYQTTVRLHHVKKGWEVIWEPAAVNPDLHSGDTLAVHRAAPERAAILDGAGQPIVTNRPVVTVGLHPKEVTDPASIARQLGDAFASVGVQIDLSDLPARVKNADPDALVEVVTLRRDAYDKIREKIHDLPGTVFRESALPLAPTRTFARALLGRVDQVQKDRMDAHPGKYVVGDLVGYGGLQERYDDRLRGVDGVSVVIVGHKDGDGSAASDAATSGDGKVLMHSDPKPGQPVKTTIDVATQNAADAALAGQKNRAALVAIRISDGAVLAVANGPDGGDQNLAFTAQVPPGSTFKTVTALGVLDSGQVTADTVVPCPKTITVDGREFHNYEGELFGDVPLHVDFAKSCNTAFASLAPKLAPDKLGRYAADLGIGVPWDMGVDVFSGKVSVNGSKAEQAAAAFGQGATIVSPVAMAGAAAAVARGQWKQPHLLLDPAAGKPAADGPQLKPSAVDALKGMMREVVTNGTATRLRSVPGPPVYGKTGTAEYDNNPDHAHSWFMGVQGDVAFAVFVENGGVSTDAAVPIAAKFCSALH
ncbi:MAG TPA: penicillin-binding transpeptidase domain-containing protein [Micromonosporaceae bacterium]